MTKKISDEIGIGASDSVNVTLVDRVLLDKTMVVRRAEYELNEPGTPRRINVRDTWAAEKTLGTLPWDGMSTNTKFAWKGVFAGEHRTDIIQLNVHKFIANGIDELAYSASGHTIEVLRKIADFKEAT